MTAEPASPQAGRSAVMMLPMRLLLLQIVASLWAIGSATKPAVKLPSGLTSAELGQLRALFESQPVKTREFGVGGASHQTVFLNQVLEDAMPGLRVRLLQLAERASTVGEWGIFHEGMPYAVSPRCFELIRYRGGGSAGNDSIGWHNDGATLVTMAIMLSDAAEYEGGLFEVSPPVSRYQLQAGEAIAWRGWQSHRVAPVTRGVREVFVVEWWAEADCTRPGATMREDDSLAGLKIALGLDSQNAPLLRAYAEQVCTQKQLPCGNAGAADEAERAFRRAVELQPAHALTVFDLGFFLITSEQYMVRREGVDLCRQAHELDPEVVLPLPAEVEALAQLPPEMLSKLYKMGGTAMFLAVLYPLIRHHEKKTAGARSGQRQKAQ